MRISSDKQIDNTSLDTQESICRQYCQREGLEVVGIQKHEAVSAKSNNVKRIAQLLDFCKLNKGNFEVLVVYKLDRFARDTQQHLWLRSEILKLGITLRSSTEKIDETSQGYFLETILAAVAQLDNDVRKERSKNGLWRRIEEGLWPWQPPTGYLRPKVIGVRLGVCEWDLNCSQAIIDIFTLYSTGAYTKGQLASLMNKKKIKDYRGVTLKFSQQYIDKILDNKFYAGLLVTNDGKIVKGKHKPIISVSLWEKCQTVLNSKTNNTINKRLYNNPDFTLRRFTICEECKRPITASWAKGNGGRYAYYYCSNKSCKRYGKMTTKQTLEDKFCEYLKQVKPKEEFISLFEKVFIKRYQERMQEIKGDYLRQLDEVKKLENDMQWLIEKGKKGVISDNLLEKQLKDAEQALTLAKIDLTDMHAEELDINSLLNYAMAFIRTIDLVWYDALPEARTKYQRLVFPEGVIFNGEEFSNQRLGLPFKLINDIATKNTIDVRMRGVEPPRFLRALPPQGSVYTISPHPRANLILPQNLLSLY